MAVHPLNASMKVRIRYVCAPAEVASFHALMPMQVERPSEALPPAAEAALQVAARVFAFESRMQDGGAAAVLAPAPHTQLPSGRGRCGFLSRVLRRCKANNAS